MSTPAPVQRLAGRVIVVDDDERVLLLRGSDPRRPEAGTWWFTPGGGVEPGESTRAAARRELAEETGLDLAELGPVVLHRDIEFDFDGTRYLQSEDLFLVHVPAFEIDVSRWTAVEVASISGHRWWPLDELADSGEVVHPLELVDLVRRQLSARSGGRR